MGSFDETCALSGLPITAGDAVRHLLLTQSPECRGGAAGRFTHGQFGRWAPRVIPVRGTYDGYGRVTDVRFQVQRDLWMRAFREDLVERGTGENATRGGCVTKQSSLDAILEQVYEGRVCVHDALSECEAWSIPRSVPTRRRVTRRLARAGLAVVTGEEASIDPRHALYVTRCGRGQVRVRAHVDDVLALAATALEGDYATMLRAGRSVCSYGATELLVAAKPGARVPPASRRATLAVASVMVRNDVWCELAYTPSTDAVRAADARSAFGNAVAAIRRGRTLDREMATAGMQSSESIEELATDVASSCPFVRTPILFRVGPAEAWRWMLLAAVDGTVAAPEIEDFVMTCAEFVAISNRLARVRHTWSPPALAVTDPDPASHIAYFRALEEVARRQEATNA